MKGGGRRWSLVLFAVSSLLCGLIGLYTGVRGAGRAARLRPSTSSELKRGEAGREVLIEGHVSERNQVQLADLRLVACVRESRSITADRKRTYGRDWRVRERVTPPLWLELADGAVLVANDDYALEGGQTFYQGDASRYRPNVRYRGIRPGDPVIAVGVVVPSDGPPQIEARFVAYGTRSSYVAQRSVGGVLACAGSAVVGLAVGVIYVWEGLFPRRREDKR